MATIGTAALTLVDWAKRLDPDGSTAEVAELLGQVNDLSDALYIEGNLPTGNRGTVRTSLPSVGWRLLNTGTTASKSTTAQIDENCGMLEAWSEVDCKLAELNGNKESFLMSEASAFTEALAQEAAQTTFYGNAGLAPEEFTGFATRYSALGRNCISAGGSGSDNSSIYLIGWGAKSVAYIYPKGSKAGLAYEDKGKVTSEVTAGVGGQRMEVYRSHWMQDIGLFVKDWRYAVRIANIDISNLVGESSAADLSKLMIKAINRLPSTRGKQTSDGTVGIKPVFYMNRTTMEMLDIQRRNVMAGYGTSYTGGSIAYKDVDGMTIPYFQGIPIRIIDQLLETEAAVA